MYDPIYLVESQGFPLTTVQIGELGAFIRRAGREAYSRCTVWCVDESGQMVIVTRENHEPR